jgi:dihydrofolate reductase
VYLTEVDADVEGDVFFPSFDRSRFRETELERHPADERHAFPFRILRLDRK